MNVADYRESLRRYSPRLFVNGRKIDSVADEPLLAGWHRRPFAPHPAGSSSTLSAPRCSPSEFSRPA
jgi:hypothetical protein